MAVLLLCCGIPFILRLSLEGSVGLFEFELIARIADILKFAKYTKQKNLYYNLNH